MNITTFTINKKNSMANSLEFFLILHNGEVYNCKSGNTTIINCICNITRRRRINIIIHN